MSLQRLDDRLSAVLDLKFRENLSDVRLYGFLANEERVGDQLVRSAQGELPEHFHFTEELE